MSVPRPTEWPTIFPPQGGYEEVGAIADYLNEPILAAQDQYNANLVAQGKPRLWGTQFEAVYLPLYPRDGWRNLGAGIPPYQIIGPLGVGGFGLHEFLGHPEIRTRIDEMQGLALARPSYPPAPAPAPVPPPATPPTGPAIPPGTPPPIEPVPGVITFEDGTMMKLVVSDTRLGIQLATPIRLSRDTIAFFWTNPDNLEVFVKLLDGRGVNGHVWVFSAGLTDVGCELVVSRGNQTRRYGNEQGQAFPTRLDTSAF